LILKLYAHFDSGTNSANQMKWANDSAPSSIKLLIICDDAFYVRIFKDKANFREISESCNLMVNKGEIDSSFFGWNILKIEWHNDKNNYVRQQREKYKRKVKLVMDVRKLGFYHARLWI
jgi:hypothetical protein